MILRRISIYKEYRDYCNLLKLFSGAENVLPRRIGDNRCIYAVRER